jgi:hypothetical protein
VNFTDTSNLVSPLSFDLTCDANRLVKVRGVLLDSRGNPCGQPVSSTKVAASTLLAGICPVTKAGEVKTSLDWQPPGRRRNSIPTYANDVKTSSRSSFVASGSSVGGAGSTGGNTDSGSSDADVPVSLGQEQLYDWSVCKPGHRQGQTIELEDGLFAVTIPGEPVVWIFSRRAPTGSVSRSSSLSRLSASGTEAWFESGRQNRLDSSRAGGMVFLVEVHYYFRIETGNVSASADIMYRFVTYFNAHIKFLQFSLGHVCTYVSSHIRRACTYFGRMFSAHSQKYTN